MDCNLEPLPFLWVFLQAPSFRLGDRTFHEDHAQQEELYGGRLFSVPRRCLGDDVRHQEDTSVIMTGVWF